MNDTDRTLDAIARAADELVPRLTERLERHKLGEIEVIDGDLRLRVRAGPATSEPAPSAGSAAEQDAQPQQVVHAHGHEDATTLGVGAPAVGFFVYADGLGPGLAVGKGDAIGHVEMLGVRHDVRAPRRGTVRNLVAESGEAVEYGQVVVEIDPGEGS